MSAPNYSTVSDDVQGFIAGAIAAERKRCAKIAEEWMDRVTMKLRAGEMTVQELRTSRAVVASISRAIRAYHK